MLEVIIIIAIVGILIILGLRLPDVIRESKDIPSTKPATKPFTWFEDTKNIPDPLGLANREDLIVPEHEPAPSLEMADALFAQKDYERAEKLYLLLAKQDPRNPKLYTRLGVLFLEQQNYADARDAFKAALAIDDGKASRHYNYAMACYQLGQMREAQDAMIQALKRDPKNPKYLEFADQIRKSR